MIGNLQIQELIALLVVGGYIVCIFCIVVFMRKDAEGFRRYAVVLHALMGTLVVAIVGYYFGEKSTEGRAEMAKQQTQELADAMQDEIHAVSDSMVQVREEFTGYQEKYAGMESKLDRAIAARVVQPQPVAWVDKGNSFDWVRACTLAFKREGVEDYDPKQIESYFKSLSPSELQRWKGFSNVIGHAIDTAEDQ